MATITIHSVGPDQDFPTLQAAFDSIAGQAPSSETVVFLLTEGIHAPVKIDLSWIGSRVIIKGNEADPSLTQIHGEGIHAINIDGPLHGILQVHSVKLTTNTSGYGIRHNAQGMVEFENVEFGDVAYSHIKANVSGSIIRALGDYKITGGALIHAEARFCGLCQIARCSTVIEGSPNFAHSFVYGSRGGIVDGKDWTHQGDATGKRYIAEVNGIIWTNGASEEYFPGTIPGTSATGGIYA